MCQRAQLFRACIRANFRREFTLFNRYLHDVRNEPGYPVVVWALAQAPGGEPAGPVRPAAG